MARKQFVILYQDGSKRNVSTMKRDLLLRAKEIEQTGPLSYRFTGQAKTFHGFVDLAQWLTAQSLSPAQMRHYLERLAVIFELGLDKQLELEETPEAFMIRLEQMGWQAEA